MQRRVSDSHELRASFRTLSCAMMAAWCVGCLDNSCPQVSEDPVIYTDGTTNEARTIYESSKPNEPFLRFPAGRIFRMEHGLGQAPTDYGAVVSFIASGGDNAIAPGNMAQFNVDERYIQVENDTCTDMFIKVTASGASPLPVSGALDAAAEPSITEPDAQPDAAGDAN